MTLKELKNKVSIGCCTHGTFKVTITYRGKEFSCASADTLAYDVIKFNESTPFYTLKQAYQALYDEAISIHNYYSQQ